MTATVTTKVIEVEHDVIRGDLVIPEGSDMMVIFAHGSGSGRLSPRNRYVAESLQKAGCGTFLVDLLTFEEDEVDRITAQYRFNIELLAGRLTIAAKMINEQYPEVNIGYYGASTGAAAALISSVTSGLAKTVVSRGGRPDLAGEFLKKLNVPVLLIVGGEDHTVLRINKDVMEKIPSEVRLQVIPGATHLFEEPGTLDQVAILSADWFKEYLKS